MRNLHLSLLQEIARMETQQGIAELQKRIDVLEEVLAWRMSAEEQDVNPFEGQILWSN